MPSSGGRRQRAVDGRQSWSIAFGLTNRSVMAYGTNGAIVRANTACELRVFKLGREPSPSWRTPG